jgi:hypothetical protein
MTKRPKLSYWEQRQREVGFVNLGIEGHIGRATEMLRELVADGVVTVEMVQSIEAASGELQDAISEAADDG